MCINVTKNNNCVSNVPDYAEWERNTELVLMSYCILTAERHKKRYPEERFFVDKEYAKSIAEYSCAYRLYLRFIMGSSDERLTMSDEIDKVEERLCRYNRSLITCTCGAKNVEY